MNAIGPIPTPVTDYPLAGLLAGASAGSVPGRQGGRSLEGAARGLEEVFLSLLVKEMRQGMDPEDGLFGKDSGDVMGGMFDQFMSQHLVQAGGIGLARMFKQHLEHAHPHGPDRPAQPGISS